MTQVKSTLETLLSEIKADVNVKENKGGKSKDNIYKLSGLTTDEMKKSRNQIRSKMDKLASYALSALKRENGIKEDTKEGIKNFIAY